MKAVCWLAALAAGLAMSTAARADLLPKDKAMLQDAVERCGRLGGTTLAGKPLVEAGPFLHDLISLADSLGASDPERQLLRIDFTRASERHPEQADSLPADRREALRQAATDCQTRYARK